MTVHVGEITSEVSATAPRAGSDDTAGDTDDWEERVRLAAMLERVERDRCRTATGYGDD